MSAKPSTSSNLQKPAPQMDNEYLSSRIDRVETRADVIENRFMAEVSAIHEKLNQLSLTLAGRRDCPQPGMCIHLQERLTKLENEFKTTEKELRSIQKWQAGIMATVSVVGALLLFFGPLIRAKLGIPN